MVPNPPSKDAEANSREPALVGLIVRPGIESAIELGHEVLKWAKSVGDSVLCEEETAKILSLTEPGALPKEIARRCDPIIALGGDGTLIGIAHFIEGESPTLVGVNFGHLGFLTELAPSELLTTLPKVRAGTAPCSKRSMLLAEIFRDGKMIFSGQGINEAVLLKGSNEPLIDIDVTVDDDPVMRLRTDGLILSTSTGSTAYSLAAGGSIVYPTLPVMLLTPICPHSLTARPLVLRLESCVKLFLPRLEGKKLEPDIALTIDGQLSASLRPGDEVRITRSSNTVKVVRSPSRSYFEILRVKLNWGIANKPD